MRLRALAAATVSSLALASCVGPQGREAQNLPPPPPSKPSQPYVPTTAKTAILAGVTRGPTIASLSIDPAKADTVLAAFRSSCAALLKRTDGSGLTTAADWQPACTAAASWPQGQGVSFFQRYFSPPTLAQQEHPLVDQLQNALGHRQRRIRHTFRQIAAQRRQRLLDPLDQRTTALRQADAVGTAIGGVRRATEQRRRLQLIEHPNDRRPLHVQLRDELRLADIVTQSPHMKQGPSCSAGQA